MELKKELPEYLISPGEHLVKTLCDRKFGIGADGIIFALPSSNKSDLRMKILNSDGSEAEMCGNGVRCLAKFVIEKIYKHNSLTSHLKIETLAGLITAEFETSEYITVDMGAPSFSPSAIPTELPIGKLGLANGTIDINGIEFELYSVSMGNPHVIIYSNEIANLNINKIGSTIENHSLFPEKTNVHFAHILDRSNIEVLTWERGCGQTYACGTGACATAVVSYKLGLCGNDVQIKLKGGNLFIRWPNEGSSVLMKGTACFVYEGCLNLDNII